jgi:prepilin-type processing-associated H-X9-DG protein
MQDDPTPKPAQPLDFAHPQASPKRTRLWLWIALGIAALFLAALTSALFSFLARLSAHRVESANNLRQIGGAILAYTSDFHGQYPDAFADLLLREDITSSVFIAPNSRDTLATGPTRQAIAANLAAPGHCSYIYLGKGLTAQTFNPDIVLAYEPANINNNQGGNVLFMDGHVEFIEMPAMNAILNQITAGVRPVHYPLLPTTAPTTKR